MAKLSDPEDWNARKERVIGLGERSFRKSYYPQLRENLDRLERFRALLDRTTDFVVLVALPEAVVADANIAFADLLGEPVDALIGRPMTKLGLERAEEALGKLREGMASWKPGDDAALQPFVVEFRFGEGRTWLELTCRTARIDERFYGVIVGRDISDRKKAHELAAALLAEKEALLDNALVGIAMLRQRQIVSCNRRFDEMFGYPAGALVGQSVRRLYLSDADFAASGDYACLPLSGGQGHASARVMVRSDGSPFWCELAGRAIDPDKPQEGSIWIFTDVTESKQAEERLRESEETFRALVEGASDAYLVHDMDGRIVKVNRMACESLGYEREELLKMRIFDIDPGLEPGPAAQAWCRQASGHTMTSSSHYRRKDGTLFPVEVRISSAFIKGQKTLIALARDVTEQVQAAEAQKLAATVYRQSSEGMLVTDENNRIVAVNQAFIDMTGYGAADVIGKNPSVLKSGRNDAAFYRAMWEQIRQTGRFRGEVWNKKKSGEFFAAQLSINTIVEKGVPRRYVALMSDVTERKRSDDLIWKQANFDNLTGLPNRSFFRNRLEHDIRNAKRTGLPAALMFLDLDGFKHVNDTLGHDMGDLLLKEAAGRLHRCVRETDTVARLGGDEFTVILTELYEPGNIDQVARHILQALSEPIRLGDEHAYVSASIGITLFPNDAADVEGLVKNADQAMYSAKQEGKNQYHYFTPSMQEEAQRRMRVINDLRGALDQGQFEIFYQPIVELASGTAQKAEALIRWHHPSRGLISPVEFISAAEDTGMIASFGDWVFREASRQASLWRERFLPSFQVSVNISPVQFRKNGIDPSVWFGHLRSLGLPGQGVVVEITEGLLLEASSKVTDQLLMLRDAGIEVALDDFGTGYSSLSYLKKFDIDYIKIDRSFVRNLHEGSDDMALCEAIVAMAHKLGIKAIAEGVETAEQAALLRKAGCDYAQGYLFSRPVSAAALERFLLEAVPYCQAG